MLINKPFPSIPFILIYAGLVLFLVAVPLFLRHFRKLRGWLAVVVFIIGFAGALFFLNSLFSGFDTVYTLDSGTLSLRSGFWARDTVDLSAIKEIAKVQVNWQGLAWALNRTGFCNRFTNGIRLETDHGSIILSPKDPAAFADEIRVRQRRRDQLRRNLLLR